MFITFDHKYAHNDNETSKETTEQKSKKITFSPYFDLIIGSIEEHEYFGEVLLGIKHVIQNHLREVQVKFQDRFLSLELDVRQRDEVITQLQHRIQELEDNPSSQKMNRVGSASLKSGSSGSIDMPFVVSLNFHQF